MSDFEVLCRNGHVPIGYNEANGSDACPLCAAMRAIENHEKLLWQIRNSALEHGRTAEYRLKEVAHFAGCAFVEKAVPT